MSMILTIIYYLVHPHLPFRTSRIWTCVILTLVLWCPSQNLKNMYLLNLSAAYQLWPTFSILKSISMQVVAYQHGFVCKHYYRIEAVHSSKIYYPVHYLYCKDWSITMNSPFFENEGVDIPYYILKWNNRESMYM